MVCRRTMHSLHYRGILPVEYPVYRHWVSVVGKYVGTVEPSVFRVKLKNLLISAVIS
jgi:hypothetical protein